ncbi:mitochondrial fission ELM1 family protein [Jiella flava]|uniref:Mitochondrial fission ELM1 family protein n=1 Tax=Jiella flava TaxID=2816857 RepID=A0A939FZV2_9HYPH|nr:mitochondrial fission ELM1 family protein [Jiella flava]
MTAETTPLFHVWTVSEVKAGTLTQCLGVARFIDPEPHVITVRRKVSWRNPPFSPLRDLASRRPPDIIISCGGKAHSHTILLARLCRKRPLTVHLAKPLPAYEDRYDLAFISRHDWMAGRHDRPNFHPVVGVPHRIDPEEITARRSEARARYAVCERPVATLLAGGPNRVYLYDESTIDRLLTAVRALAGDGWRVLICTSRRSPSSLQQTLAALADDRIVVWDCVGENPFRDYLAAADALIVTKDSITMTCEALATGKPVYSFDLAHGRENAHLEKFERFHADMSDSLGLTRRFEGSLAPYAYEPPLESRRIAAIVQRIALQTRANGKGEVTR